MAKGKNHQPGGAAAVVEALVRPTVEGFGLRLWDVRFEKEGPDKDADAVCMGGRRI